MKAYRVPGVLGLALAAFWLGTACAETRSVIDPVEAPMPQKPPAPAVKEADDPDAIWAELGRDIPDQADNGRLGCRIGVAAAAAHLEGPPPLSPRPRAFGPME